MGKVVSSYSSVVRGVSEQVPQDRHPGQHFEQLNMVSDPVRGTARRHGSRFLAEQKVTAAVSTSDPNVQGIIRDRREFSFFMNGKEYSAIYASAPTAFPAALPCMSIYSKDEQKFLTMVIDTTGMDPYKTQGFSALTTIGDYLLAAGNNLLPAYSTVDQFAASHGNAAFWVRGGAYSRTYSMSVTSIASGGTASASYTTMASSYPFLLDTSDIPSQVGSPPVPNPDYQKAVNDRVNAYNSAATAWIGQAFADQQPSNIANKLANIISPAWAPVGGIAVSGNTIFMTQASAISTTDGGDGSLFISVLDEITGPEKVTAQHFYNKVVRVRAPGAVDSYYLKAQPGSSPSGFGPVTWIEAPAQIVTPTAAFAMGRLSADGGTFYLAGSPARLSAISGIAGTPGFAATHAGDLTALGSKPYFLDNPITCMTVFQDRLTIISNGVVFMSKSGDYFNWFRASSLSVSADDPVEMYALGTEDDIITKSVTYNKALFLFGNRNQYVIPGTSVLTSTNGTISPAAAEHGSNYAKPAVSGNLLYYGRSKKNRKNTPSPYNGAISQFQLGLFEDSPETYTASSQLDKYISGRPTELAALVEPTTLFVRTDGVYNGVYVYSFIDNPGTQQREFDSWSRWTWDLNIVGYIAGIVTYDSAVLVYTYRSDSAGTWIGAEEFVMDSDLSDLPYLDSLRPWSQYPTNAARFNRVPYQASISLSMDNTSSYFLMGATGDKMSAFATAHAAEPNALWQGVGFPAYVDITPPYIRDQNDRAYTTGDLTIGQYVVSLVDTAGVDAERTSEAVTTVVKKFNGRILGQPNTQVGRQPVSSGIIYVPVGKSNVRHRMLFRCRTWLPFCMSALSWTGQTFFNSRRV